MLLIGVRFLPKVCLVVSVSYSGIVAYFIVLMVACSHDAGDAKQKIKSQAVPKKSSGPVTVVVGKTFDKLVLDNSKDVLIELYAPWCGHCKKLEPVYRDLAKRFKDVKNLVIAKMDATTNDSPDPYTASGFPTIYFAPAGKKTSPISYSGDRSLKDLEKFIRDHATVSLARVKEEL